MSMPSDSSGRPNVARGCPVSEVDADDADGQAEQQRDRAAQLRGAQHRGHRDEREQHDRQIGRRAQRHGEPRHRGREDHQQHGADGARDERSDGRGGQGLRGAAGFGHLVALDRGDHRGRLAGRVQQDRGGRPAVHAAVEDAGEHDERRAGADVVGDRQQQCHRHRRADAGQHADRGPQQHADHRVQQVHRRRGLPEPLEQPVEIFHLEDPVQYACGQRDSEPGIERVEAADRQHRPDNDIAQVMLAAQHVAAPANSSALVIAQPSGFTSTIRATNKPTRSPTVRQSLGMSGRCPRPLPPHPSSRAGSRWPG